jgi:hypothetical protein
MCISKWKVKVNPLQAQRGNKPATEGGGCISKSATPMKGDYVFYR